MRKFFCTIVFPILLSACATPLPVPDDETRQAEESRHETAAAQIVAKRRTVDQQLEELHKLLAEMTAEFVLGPGDLLSISVYAEPDLTIEAAPVRPDGRISFPLIGDVRAAGRSVAELSEQISLALGEFLVSPSVSVIVLEFHSLDYTVDGEVVNPGVYPLTTKVSLSKAIAAAGGLNKGQYRASTIELADLTHAFVARQNKILPVDFVRLLREGDLRFDIELQPGDYIRIPSGLSKEVYVLGEVNEPMLFAYRENMPMSRTLAQAEGTTPDADLTRIHIIRGAIHNPTVIVTNFRKVIQGEERDVPLQPGDIVYVPPTGLTDWSRMMDKILPSIQTAWNGILISEAISD